MTIDELMGRAKVYEMVTPQFGEKKKLGVTVVCDGVEMTISSTAVDGKAFDEPSARAEVRGKLETFVENRPKATIA